MVQLNVPVPWIRMVVQPSGPAQWSSSMYTMVVQLSGSAYGLSHGSQTGRKAAMASLMDHIWPQGQGTS